MRDLQATVHGMSPKPQTRDEIVAHYQRLYPGVKVNKRGQEIAEWKSQLADTLSAINGRAKSSNMRRFQNRNGVNWKDKAPSKAAQREYRDLGDMIGHVPPRGGFHITGELHIKFSRVCERRDIDIYITGGDAKKFAQSPDLQHLINVYCQDDIDDENGYVPCDTEKNNFTITPVR